LPGCSSAATLTDAEWRTIEPVMGQCATLTADLREMVNACL